MEYTFRKSENEIIKKLSDAIGLVDYSPVKFSNLKAKKKRDEKLKEDYVIDYESFLENFVIDIKKNKEYGKFKKL